ncbi:SRPBCC family protein [Williamsia maris]|uniref:Polyketide cyclase / dehydrase and lipid transport n=1 Tax=Williamsia maris TaxID=72806 RepID=A0ABT1HEL9_9NOCA|nr:SRPBCC family protein [Williamsia maris]MCP2176156.1 Polyketide cyclase / dehydrase and lipid transport [Williamsia maris]
MVQVARTFTVAKDRATVVGFLRDFTNATQWDPGSQDNVQTTPGPVALGTVWHNTSKLVGVTTELDYTLVCDDADRLRFEGKNKTAVTSDDLSFADAKGGVTEITYRANVSLNGAGKIAEPIMWLVFQQIAGKTVKQITEVVEKL